MAFKIKCSQAQVEISAAAGGELDEATERHVDACPECAELREATLSLSARERSWRDDHAMAPAGAAAMARQSMEGRGRSWLWALPLASASMSVAALIVYFGLFTQIGGEATGVDAIPSTSSVSQLQLTGTQPPPMPDVLQAASDLFILSGRDTL